MALTHGLFTKTTPSSVHAQEGDYIYGANEVGIDTGVIIVGEGTLFIGQTALREMLEVMGWNITVDRDDTLIQLQKDLAFTEAERDRLAKENEELVSDLAAFGRALASQASKQS
jgi:hypothetical protein